MATTVATTLASSAGPAGCAPSDDTWLIATNPSEPGTSSQKAGRKVTAAGHLGCRTSRDRSSGNITAAASPLATGAVVTSWVAATMPYVTVNTTTRTPVRDQEASKNSPTPSASTTTAGSTAQPGTTATGAPFTEPAGTLTTAAPAAIPAARVAQRIRPETNRPPPDTTSPAASSTTPVVMVAPGMRITKGAHTTNSVTAPDCSSVASAYTTADTAKADRKGSTAISRSRR